ncbi:hypothetical protein MKEN_01140500 [Mycena kentingensis (nom. inval.)]|nr:hypothetical protein MKEN_01140500 [Mycena kentingensis (nom. inval.)]
MSANTLVPPDPLSGIFCVEGSVVIDAPRDKVWAALLDFASYKEWNPFVRNQTIISASGKPADDQTPAAGKTMLISPVHLPPTMGEPGLFGSHSTTVVIQLIDNENYRAAWDLKPSWMQPKSVLFAERWQVLTEVDGGKTKYESIEVFRGPLAHVVKRAQGANLTNDQDAF